MLGDGQLPTFPGCKKQEEGCGILSPTPSGLKCQWMTAPVTLQVSHSHTESV
ncbi:hypothetical protein I79_006730 [Cricetulus griseus]|uniref:Uncharacterized protein n=1 Tax=Cricetulus griseus TaxID=10029 RepID=G3H8M5_CRIGR|nr:hypothetical protein I79_006730 [Cricetulus griseus]